MNIISALVIAWSMLLSAAAPQTEAQPVEASPSAQQSYHLPDGWRVYPMPPDGSGDWHRANLSHREWRVRLTEGKVVIDRVLLGDSPWESKPNELPFETKPHRGLVYTAMPAPPPPVEMKSWASGAKSSSPSPRHKRDKGGWYLSDEMKFYGERRVLKVTDGWIVGFDAGEWGGAIYWFNPSGTSHYQVKLPRPVDQFDVENVRAMFPHQDSIVVFQGLSHAFDRGKVVKLTKGSEGRWSASLLAKLESEPLVCLEDQPGSWVVVTWKSVLRLNANGTRGDLCPASFTGSLYPNSIVKASDGAIYIGMRHFCARLIPEGTGYRPELLVPTALPLFDSEPEPKSTP